jgi:hypothetical protein
MPKTERCSPPAPDRLEIAPCAPRVLGRTVYRRWNAICLRDRPEVTVDQVKKSPVDQAEPEELAARLRHCEEAREQLEDDNDLLRQSSKTFGDLAERLRNKLNGKSR